MQRAKGNNSRINLSVCLKMMAGFHLYRFIPDSFSEEAGKWLEIVLLGCNNVGNQHKVLLENGGEDFENLREEINSVISNVSDIVSVVQPSGLSLVLSYQLMVIYALSDFLIMILSWLVKQSLRAFLFQEVQP
ncbi:hypothetical protein [Mediterraneibacter sp.]|uniref:hypothetical protein n=1 Tax=Mediterraneibacter sp. TaxID=2316022 RepID=UPI0039930D16